MTAKYVIHISLMNEEEKAQLPLSLSKGARHGLATQYIDAMLKEGKTEEQAIAEIKKTLETSFREGWVFFEQVIRESAK